jgi:glycosyltransferase involved in cell wall biosynthesis
MTSPSTTPRISVLLPAFDAASTLALSLRSIQRQRESSWECLVVDDGSRDRTRDIALHFAARDGRFRVLSGKHEGLVPSLVKGLEECRAPFVARMDADDWMHRDRLSAQLRHLEMSPEIAAVGCHVRLFPRAQLAPGMVAYESWLNSIVSPALLERDAYVECPIAHPTLFIRRSELQHFGYRSCGWPEDYDLILRMLAAGRLVDVLPRRLLGWRDGNARLSRTGLDYRIERFTACKAAHLALGFLATEGEYILWGYGHTGRALYRELARLERRPSQIVELHPGRLGQTIHGAQVVAPDALRTLPRRPIVVSVAGELPRGEIRRALATMGFEEGVDFVCAA